MKKAGSLYALKRIGPRGNRGAARSYCSGLGKFGNVKGWRMPSLAEVKRVGAPKAQSGFIWISEGGVVFDQERKDRTRAGPKKVANAYCVAPTR